MLNKPNIVIISPTQNFNIIFSFRNGNEDMLSINKISFQSTFQFEISKGIANQGERGWDGVWELPNQGESHATCKFYVIRFGN